MSIYSEDYFSFYLIEYVFSTIFFSRTNIGTFVGNFFWQSKKKFPTNVPIFVLEKISMKIHTL